MKFFFAKFKDVPAFEKVHGFEKFIHVNKKRKRKKCEGKTKKNKQKPDEKTIIKIQNQDDLPRKLA